MTYIARVDVEHRGELPIVAVDGEIDASNTGEIGEAIHGALTNLETALVVDLTRTSYLDSAGINLLFALGTELRDRQQRLHLVVADGSPIARMLAISGFAEAERTHATRDEAVAAATG